MSNESLKFHMQNNSRVIIVNPGDHILAHTNEFIGGKNFIFGSLGSRSTIRRDGGEVCRDAGIGDVGYRSLWTLEINNSTSEPLLLVVGHRYGQVLFNKCTGPISSTPYGQDKESNKYQQTNDILIDKQSWTPYKMLPKKFLDREVREFFNINYNKNIFATFDKTLTFDNKFTKFESENELFGSGYYFVIESLFKNNFNKLGL
jgi:deoxycytidine triphosphate deaminase